MTRIIITILLILQAGMLSFAQHPCLTLTENGVKNIKRSKADAPLFDKTMAAVKQEIDHNIELGIDVPWPKDMAGGYTHEQHKKNYKLMHKAGNLFQFTGDKKYAQFVKEMLFEYAEMYPQLPLHPTMKSYATGKIFWQCLNDANWLVFTSQAYDCIYNYLSRKDRKRLEQDLFIPYANFLSVENPKFFNRIHNHSTWANAAVGMIALAMKNDTLLEKSLYGLKNDGINPEEVDNDGGYIKKDGIRQAGFLAQLDYSFSPEGYFTEGPYYQRYAIFPFLVFSHALYNNRPDLKIFEYRDGILKKATNALLQLTDPSGNFFPINDSQKGMSYKSYEIVTAVDLVCMVDKSQKTLLDWAALQIEVAFNETGYFVAEQLGKKSREKPIKTSQIYGDGVDGKAGGLAVLRLDSEDLLFKFSSHGMGHGHFDRLSYGFYDPNGEVVQDYGAVRWVNIDQKAGGRYLPENKTFGKQTIGHNTLVVNEESQFKGAIKLAEKDNPILYYYNANDPKIKIVSAQEPSAYDQTALHRTLILLKDDAFDKPILIDLFKINAEKSNATYDLPLWFTGHMMKSSFDCPKSATSLEALGEEDGYQHIWKESECSIKDDNFSFNWFSNNRFYTLHGFSQNEDQIIMGRAGANDPNYNLRNDAVMIHRKSNSANALFYNVLESHGSYSTITEIPIKPYSQIKALDIIYNDDDYIVCSFGNADTNWQIHFALNDNNESSKHSIKANDTTYNWDGVYNIIKTKID